MSISIGLVKLEKKFIQTTLRSLFEERFISNNHISIYLEIKLNKLGEYFLKIVIEKFDLGKKYEAELLHHF